MKYQNFFLPNKFLISDRIMYHSFHRELLIKIAGLTFHSHETNFVIETTKSNRLGIISFEKLCRYLYLKKNLSEKRYFLLFLLIIYALHLFSSQQKFKFSLSFGLGYNSFFLFEMTLVGFFFLLNDTVI